ncbi:hypothetical protein AGMMS4957_19500 [Bacteroidia bacterium]|nr:hypothetical protein AGMMS4957_19500 [Bacteroidia bacterium]
MKNALLTILFAFAACAGLEAENWHSTHRLSTLTGLPTDEVKQVFQDREGYIWIATHDGLCRYDGHQLKTYKSNLYTPNLLSSNSLTAIAEDNNHHLWIGTSNGLNVLNKITGEIKQIDPKRLSGANIQAILATRDNQVWVGTANGLNRYVAENDSFIRYNSTHHNLQTGDIKSLVEDSKGNIWIGTWSEGITRYNPAEGRFLNYPRLNAGNSAHVIFEDRDNNIWVGSWDYGLFRLENPYNPQQVKYINYRHDRNNPRSLSDNIVYALAQDLNTQAIWVGTRSGLSVLNNKDNTASFTNHLPSQSNESLPYNEVNSILRDKSGLMWLGTLGGGVSTVNTRPAPFELNTLEEVKKRLSSNSVRSIYVDKAGNKWLGIGSYGLETDHPGFQNNPIASTVYKTIQLNGTNAYWIATYGQGIFVYDPASPTNKVQNIRVNPQYPWLANDCVFDLYEDTNNLLWVGTLDGIGVYNPQTNTGISYPSLGQTSNPGEHYSVVGMAEEDAATMWLATAAHGVFCVKKDPMTSKIISFRHYQTATGKVNSNNIHVIYKDSQSRLWLGSNGGGLSLFDREKDAFVGVQQDYDLPGDIVYSIEEDDAGTLFMGTNAGLVSLAAEVTHIYTVADGLQDNAFNRGAAFKAAGGRLYFGGHKGYNSFNPAELKNRKFAAPVVITDIKLFNTSLENLPPKLRKKVSTEAAGYTKTLRIPYSSNNFTIEFAALNYAHTNQERYAYKLDGFDKDWRQADDTRRFASYNNLYPGTYHFALKSSLPLTVIVLPPWYLTWWAYLLYTLLIAAAIYLGVKLAKERAAHEFQKQFVYEPKQMNFTNINEEFLNNAIECIHTHIADVDFDQQHFADALGVSKSTLYKKLKSQTGLNPSLFMRHIRLKTARQRIIDQRGIRISELAYSVGFNDPKYFSACFKKEFGILPSEYLDVVMMGKAN